MYLIIMRNTFQEEVTHVLFISLYKWDLVCHRRGKNKATATIFFVGVMFGAMSFGSLSDRYQSLLT